MAVFSPPPAAVEHSRLLWTGTLFALAAGLTWGLVFVVPLLLPQYPAPLLSVARYLAFGLIAVPLAWWDRARIAALSRSDWAEATKLAAVGNLLYYLCLAAAIQRAGGPLPTMVIGTLPVVIAVCSNLRDGARDGRLRWRTLAAPLALLAAGIACVNHSEWQQLRAGSGAADPSPDQLRRYAEGVLLAVGAVVCWTWYPLRNADWLRDHPGRSASTWATAQGLATLPLAALGFVLWWAWGALSGSTFPMPAGPEPLRFVALMLAVGLLASWLGTLCWNEASQRLPTTVAGQLIVFETLAALAYAYVLRGRWPDAWTLAGVALLVAGVLWAVRLKPQRLSAASTL
jgi:drug/metabolite transporter (DMT)-like permease